MKKIIVPCDFSEPAINAFRFALDVALKSKGELHVLNIVELPVMYDTTLMPVLSFEQSLLNDMKADAEKNFKKIGEKYNTGGVNVIFKVEFGVMTGTILDYAEKQAADSIIMGSHGASGLKEFLIGSNAEKIVRTSPIPVIIIKDYFKGPITRIVFPNTLETVDQEDLVMKVKALQNFFNAELHVVWINTPGRFYPDPVSFQRLEDFAKRFMLKDYVLSVFNHLDEEAGILQYTERINGNMIAMGTSGRRGIAHLINGSKAEDVVNHSKSLIWTSVIEKDKK